MYKYRIFYRAIFLAVIFLFFTRASIADVGSIKGNFQVTPTGQAHYSMPIDVPPGTANMVPALSIVYDSSSSNTRNGLLGMGFSLEGLTAITRCPANKTQNGLIHGVGFTDQDRFCLGGEQLVAVRGVYGADGTEYRTYIDSKTKVVSYGRQGNGPASFRVWTKGGQIAEYGITADSQVKAQGKGTVAFWGLNRIQDSVGNFLDVHYFKDENQGSFYPIEVNYTGNARASLAPYNSVRFIYEERLDTKTTYQAGSKSTLDKRLKTIQVFQGSTLVYEYRLMYEIGRNTYRSRMISIQKCSGGGVCLPATRFGWQTNEEGWEEAPEYEPPVAIINHQGDANPHSIDNGVRFVDLTGDGLLGMVQHVWWNSGNVQKGAWINNGHGWESVPQYIPPTPIINNQGDSNPYGIDNGVRFVDLTGDGLLGMVQHALWNPSNIQTGAWINNGHGWESAPQYTPPPAIVNNQGDSNPHGIDNGMRFADLTGNGLLGMVQHALWNPINPLNQSASQVTDPRFGVIVDSIDLSGLKTVYQYDDFAHLIVQIDPDGTRTDISYQYVDASRVMGAELAHTSYVITRQRQNSTTQKEYYDTLGRMICNTTQGVGGTRIIQITCYDKLGRVTKKTLPFFSNSKRDNTYHTSIHYDVLGRIIQTIFPDETAIQIIYDGFTTTTVNQLKQRQVKQVNAIGEIIRVVDNLGSITTYKYDAYSNMVAVTDSAGNISRIEYDRLGSKTAIIDPDKGHWTYQYDALGNLTSQTDALGRTTTFGYDKLGRMIRRTDPAGTSTWEYDTARVGKLTKVDSLVGKTDPILATRAIHDGLEAYTRNYSYDSLGRTSQIITVVRSQTYTSSYVYGPNSRIDIETYPNGLQVKNSYNELGFLIQISDVQTGKVYWRLNAKDASGHIVSESYSNGLITNYNYDPKTNFLLGIDTVLSQPLLIQQGLLPELTATTATPQRVSVTPGVQKEVFRYDVVGNVRTSEFIRMLSMVFLKATNMTRSIVLQKFIPQE